MKIKLLSNVIHAGQILARDAAHEIADPHAQALIKRGLASAWAEAKEPSATPKGPERLPTENPPPAQKR